MTKKIKRALPVQERIEGSAKLKGILLDFPLHKWPNLIERDVVQPVNELPIISVDFSNIQGQFSNLPDGHLQERPISGYHGPEEKREPNLKTPLKWDLQREQALKALFEFLMVAPAEVFDAQIKLAREQGATFPFSKAAEGPVDQAPPVLRPADAPPLWAERKPGWNTTGKKSSCALWIKMHYGNKNPENWEPMELQLKDLRHDKALYDAFAKWIETHPEDDFDPQVRRQVVRYTDPKEAVERLRGQKRASEARLRKVR